MYINKCVSVHYSIVLEMMFDKHSIRGEDINTIVNE